MNVREAAMAGYLFKEAGLLDKEGAMKQPGVFDTIRSRTGDAWSGLTGRTAKDRQATINLMYRAGMENRDLINALRQTVAQRDQAQRSGNIKAGVALGGGLGAGIGGTVGMRALRNRRVLGLASDPEVQKEIANRMSKEYEALNARNAAKGVTLKMSEVAGIWKDLPEVIHAYFDPRPNGFSEDVVKDVINKRMGIRAMLRKLIHNPFFRKATKVAEETAAKV